MKCVKIIETKGDIFGTTMGIKLESNFGFLVLVDDEKTGNSST